MFQQILRAFSVGRSTSLIFTFLTPLLLSSVGLDDRTYNSLLINFVKQKPPSEHILLTSCISFTAVLTSFTDFSKSST